MNQLLQRVLHGQAHDPATGEPEAFVELTAVVWREGDEWVSHCPELDIASSGNAPEEAFEELLDAVTAYLNTLEELGERDQVLGQRGVPLYVLAPAEYHVSIDRR